MVYEIKGVRVYYLMLLCKGEWLLVFLLLVYVLVCVISMVVFYFKVIVGFISDIKNLLLMLVVFKLMVVVLVLRVFEKVYNIVE